MRTPNLLLYVTSIGMYLACFAGVYNLIAPETTEPQHQQANLQSPVVNSPAPGAATGQIVDTPGPADSAGGPKQGNPLSDDPMNRALAPEEGFANSSDGPRPSLESGSNESASQHLKENLSNTAGGLASALDSDLVKAASQQMKENFSGSESGVAPSIDSETVKAASQKLAQVASSAAPGQEAFNQLASQAESAVAEMANQEAAPPSGGPNVPSSAEISKSAESLSQNVAKMSGVPDSLKDAVGQAGMAGGPEVNPQDYFEGAPPVSAASVGMDKQGEQATNSTAENLAIMASAAKGLSGMAANLSAEDVVEVVGNLPIDMPEAPSAADAPVAASPEARSAPSPKAGEANEVVEQAEPEMLGEETGKDAGSNEFLLTGLSVLGGVIFGVWGLRKAYIKWWPEVNTPEDTVKKLYDQVNGFYHTEDYRMAETVLREIVKRFPDELEARFSLGGMLWKKLNDPQRAFWELNALRIKITKDRTRFDKMERLENSLSELEQVLTRKREAQDA
ncbi:MAG: hypothetical protein G3M78_02770 [Candidatus Nitrohelix vancouverensis]|uniref:Tetratricopeptide repeat protein n=1 Tax=Candidatus Nitrohelix vancouverensis TaxID=2705534 RepID=A0A7T0C0L9_9BACT|nr:MAG: hypothetical protein G3M78_02770 [Candidatus Nitrohelix vancouverensis]